eukprot:3704652-Amphidinium_carterae.1
MFFSSKPTQLKALDSSSLNPWREEELPVGSQKQELFWNKAKEQLAQYPRAVQDNYCTPFDLPRC